MRENFAIKQEPLFVEKMHRADSFSPYDNPCVDFYSVQICQPPALPLSNLANFASPPPILLQTPKSPADEQTIYVAKILAYLPQLHHQQRQKHPRQLFHSPVPKIITAEEARLAQEIAASLGHLSNAASSPRDALDAEFLRANQGALPLHQGARIPEGSPLTSKFEGREPYDEFGEHGHQLVQQCDQKLDALEIKTEPIWDFHKTQLTESVRNFVPLLQTKSPPLRSFDGYDSSESEIYKMPPPHGTIRMTSPPPSPQTYIISGEHINSNYSNVSPQSFTSSSSSEHTSSITGGSDSGIDSLTSHNFSSSPNESDLRPHHLIDEMSEKRRKTMSTTGGFLLPPKKRKYTDVVTPNINDQITVAANTMQSKLKSDRNIRSPPLQPEPSPPSVLPISKNFQTGSCPNRLPPRPALIVANPMAKVLSSEPIKTSFLSPTCHTLTSEDTERLNVNSATKANSPDTSSTAEEFSRFSSTRERVICRNRSYNRSMHMFGYGSPESPLSSTFSPLSSASVSPAPAPGLTMSSQVTSSALSTEAESIAVPPKISNSNTSPTKRPSTGGTTKKGPDSLTCFIRHRSQNIPKEKTFVCEHANCNKAYAKAAHLKSHLRVHTGERPFPCEWPGCSKQFVRSDELKRHMRVHTGENRFICPLCSMKFKRSDHLTKHAKKHPNFHMDMLRRPEDIEKRQKEMMQSMFLSMNNGSISPALNETRAEVETGSAAQLSKSFANDETIIAQHVDPMELMLQ